MVTLDEFALITRRVIARDGFEGYLPTALYPERRHILHLDGVPDDADLEPIATRWAAASAVGDEEYLAAFKVSATQFKIMRRSSAGQEEGVFDVADDG